MPKNTLCHHWLRGHCKAGSNCTWAHGRAELTESNHTAPRHAAAPRHTRPAISHKKQLLFKTSLCETFEREGSCPYGDKCRYAHGKDELKEKPDFENEHIKRIMALEKENRHLKIRVRELEDLQKNARYMGNPMGNPMANPMMNPVIPMAPQPMVMNSDALQQTLLQALIKAQNQMNRSRSGSRERHYGRRGRSRSYDDE